MNKYLSIILKIFVFVFIVVTFDQVFGSILRKYYFTQTTGPDYELTRTLEDCKADILVFGNSRAVFHYDTRLIKDSLKRSCFNAGQINSVNLLMPYALIKVMTTRYSPKAIILEFNSDFYGGSGAYDRLSVLLPYYEEYPEIRSILLLRSPYEKMKLMSAIYPFNSNIVYIFKYNTNLFSPRQQVQDVFDGFVLPESKLQNIGMSEKKAMIEKEAEIEKEGFLKSTLDTNKINAFKNIILICKEKNIPLFLINSPVFHVINEEQIPPAPTAKLALDFINQNKVNYFNFSFDSTFQGHMELFSDRLHLNENGAKIFTNMVIDILKKNNICYSK